MLRGELKRNKEGEKRKKEIEYGKNKKMLGGLLTSKLNINKTLKMKEGRRKLKRKKKKEKHNL